MTDGRHHPAIPKLVEDFQSQRFSRREFLRTATLLGMSASAAYAIAGGVTMSDLVPSARADTLPKGGSLRFAHRVGDISNPQAVNWLLFSDLTFPVVQTLTRTWQDNITRPHLAEAWEPSEDLRTWTIRLRKNAKWHSGRPFVADDIIWNIKRLIDPATGSSSLGLMSSYLVTEKEEGGSKTVELWDANALEKVDDFTLRLNLKTPQVTIPEHLYHYTSVMLDPADNGVMKVGSNGTGPFELVEFEVQKRALYKRRDDYWGEPAYLDTFEFVDFGDDANAAVAALASRQVDGLYEISQDLVPALQSMDQVQIYSTPTANNATLILDCSKKPWDDPRVRLALRHTVDPEKQLAVALRGAGLKGEHHHASPIHPDYAKLEPFPVDTEKAKKLLAEAGYPNGFEAEANVSGDSAWMNASLEAMVEDLKTIGVNFTIKVSPSSQFWEIWDKVPVAYSDWSHRPLAIQMYALVYRTGVPWNTAKWSNETFDKLLVEAESVVDPVERQKLVGQMEAILQQEGPMLQPLWLNYQTAMDKKVLGFKPHPAKSIYPEQLAVQA